MEGTGKVKHSNKHNTKISHGWFFKFYDLLILMVLLSIGACGHTSQYVNNRQNTFEELCDSEDRSVIYSTAEVDGYIALSTNTNTCRTPWNTLLFGKYGYKECSLESSRDVKINELTDIYRITLQKEGSSICNIEDKKLKLYQKRSYENNKDKLVGQCLGAKKILSPASTYAILYEAGYVNDEKEHIALTSKGYSGLERKKGFIRYWGYRVVNIINEDVLAIDRDYKFYPGGLVNDFAKKYECAEDPYLKIKEILIPIGR